MEARDDGGCGGGVEGRDQGRQGRAVEREELPEWRGGQVRGENGVVWTGGTDIPPFLEQWRRKARNDILYLHTCVTLLVSDHVTWNT